MVCINHMRADEKKYMAFLLHGPGLYSSPIVLGSENVNVEVAVDHTGIRSVSLVLFRAEHKEKQHDEDDGEADKKSRVDDLLHPEDDDLCF